MARPSTTPPQAPQAWIRREAIRVSIVGLSAQQTLPIVNTTRLASSIGRRPTLSESGPTANWAKAKANR